MHNVISANAHLQLQLRRITLYAHVIHYGGCILVLLTTLMFRPLLSGHVVDLTPYTHRMNSYQFITPVNTFLHRYNPLHDIVTRHTRTPHPGHHSYSHCCVCKGALYATTNHSAIRKLSTHLLDTLLLKYIKIT